MATLDHFPPVPLLMTVVVQTQNQPPAMVGITDTTSNRTPTKINISHSTTQNILSTETTSIIYTLNNYNYYYFNHY